MGPGATQRVSSPFAEKETEAGRVAVTSKVTALVPAATRGSRESASYTWHSLRQRHLVPGSDSAGRTPFLALPGAGAAGVGPTASWGNLCARKRARRSPLKLSGALQSNARCVPWGQGRRASEPTEAGRPHRLYCALRFYHMLFFPINHVMCNVYHI